MTSETKPFVSPPHINFDDLKVGAVPANMTVAPDAIRRIEESTGASLGRQRDPMLTFEPSVIRQHEDANGMSTGAILNDHLLLSELIHMAGHRGCWVSSFMHYDFGHSDLEQKTVQQIDTRSARSSSLH